MIQVQSLSKKFNNNFILQNINFEIPQGSRVALLGMNGAGKSTLLKILFGLIKPSSGWATINKMNPRFSEARKTLGIVLQTSEFVNEVTGLDILKLIIQHYPQSKTMEELLEAFILKNFIKKPTRLMSQGQKRLLSLALAFAGNPTIIFLDEPTVGMDYQTRTHVWRYIQDYQREQASIFLTTHYLEEAQQLAERILVLHNGKIIADGSVFEIDEQFSKTKVTFKMDEDNEWLLAQSNTVKVDSQYYCIDTFNSDNVVRELVRNDVSFRDLQIKRGNLDEVFVKLIGE